MVNPIIEYFPLNSISEKYTYVVIVSLYNSELVWVRKKGFSTWEIPAGHVEVGELPEEAARRELWEETGALDYELDAICDFSILSENGSSFNQLFLSTIRKFGELPNFEIEEVKMGNHIPEALTHTTIQPTLIKKALAYFQNRNAG